MAAYDFGKLSIDITPDMVIAYYKDRSSALSSLLETLVRNDPAILRGHLADLETDFKDYILNDYEGGDWF